MQRLSGLPSTPNLALIDRRKPQPPGSKPHSNTTLSKNTYIRWCCIDLSNAPRLPGVNSILLPLLLFSLIASACMAQRYGRPYTLAQSPQILLLVKTDKNHHHFRPSDLKKLPRTVVTITDRVTNSPHTHEGVALEQLLPSGGALLRPMR